MNSLVRQSHPGYDLGPCHLSFPRDGGFDTMAGGASSLVRLQKWEKNPRMVWSVAVSLTGSQERRAEVHHAPFLKNDCDLVTRTREGLDR